MFLPAVVLWVLSAWGGTLAGVTVPDSIDLGGQSLVLNGMGLREAFFIDIYVGALYLPAPTRSPDQAIDADVPKRVLMRIIFHKVTREQMVSTFKENLDRNPDAAVLQDRLDALYGFMDGLVAGDEVLLDYVPGTGTTVTIRGQVMGTLPGADLMRAIWAIFLGPRPASEKLKAGMLGK